MGSILMLDGLDTGITVPKRLFTPAPGTILAHKSETQTVNAVRSLQARQTNTPIKFRWLNTQGVPLKPTKNRVDYFTNSIAGQIRARGLDTPAMIYKQIDVVQSEYKQANNTSKARIKEIAQAEAGIALLQKQVEFTPETQANVDRLTLISKAAALAASKSAIETIKTKSAEAALRLALTKTNSGECTSIVALANAIRVIPINVKLPNGSKEIVNENVLAYSELIKSADTVNKIVRTKSVVRMPRRPPRPVYTGYGYGSSFGEVNTAADVVTNAIVAAESSIKNTVSGQQAASVIISASKQAANKCKEEIDSSKSMNTLPSWLLPVGLLVIGGAILFSAGEKK